MHLSFQGHQNYPTFSDVPGMLSYKACMAWISLVLQWLQTLRFHCRVGPDPTLRNQDPISCWPCGFQMRRRRGTGPVGLGVCNLTGGSELYYAATAKVWGIVTFWHTWTIRKESLELPSSALSLFFFYYAWHRVVKNVTIIHRSH